MAKGKSGGAITNDKTLTREQDYALEDYVSGEFMWINQTLRGRNPNITMDDLTDAEREELRHLDEATRATTVRQSKLWRSVDASALGMDDRDIDRAIYEGDTLQKIVGREFTERGFLSTTTDKKLAEDFGDFTGATNPVVIEFNVPKGIRGADTSRFDIPEAPQKEVLLARNTRYRVTSAEVQETWNEEVGYYMRQLIIHADILGQG